MNPKGPRREGPAIAWSDSRVGEEFLRNPGARLVQRERSVPSKGFDWLLSRVSRGLRYGVAARIEDHEGRILLVRMDPKTAWTGAWMTPGGGAEPGETPRRAVLREIREEAGIEVSNLRLWKVFHETIRGPRGRVVLWDFLQYTASWASGTPASHVPDEIVEVRWFKTPPRDMAFRSDWMNPPRHRFESGP